MLTFNLSKKIIIKKWYLVNAENQILGRLASQISEILLNKNNILYTPFLFPINNIIIINAEKIIMNSQKILEKKYFHYSGYPGGLSFKTFLNLKQQNPTKLLRLAISGMLPKNKLRQQIYANLYIYKGNTHIHLAQIPKLLIL